MHGAGPHSFCKSRRIRTNRIRPEFRGHLNRCPLIPRNIPAGMTVLVCRMLMERGRHNIPQLQFENVNTVWQMLPPK